MPLHHLLNWLYLDPQGFSHFFSSNSPSHPTEAGREQALAGECLIAVWGQSTTGLKEEGTELRETTEPKPNDLAVYKPKDYVISCVRQAKLRARALHHST